MNKYNKVMEKIKIDSEMELRIMSGISCAAEGRTLTKRLLGYYKPLAAVAVCVLLLVGIIGQVMNSDDNSVPIASLPGESYTHGSGQEDVIYDADIESASSLPAGSALADGNTAANSGGSNKNSGKNESNVDDKKLQAGGQNGGENSAQGNDGSGDDKNDQTVGGNIGGGGNSGQANGMIYFSSVGAMAASLNFALQIPTSLPDGYKFETAFNQNGMAGVCYVNGGRQLKYYMRRQGSDDFDNTNGRELRQGVIACEDGIGSIRIYWQKNGFSYVLIGDIGISDECWLDVIDSLALYSEVKQ